VNVYVNGAEAATRVMQDGRSFDTSAGLDAGWNTIMFTDSGGGDGMTVAQIVIDTW